MNSGGFTRTYPSVDIGPTPVDLIKWRQVFEESQYDKEYHPGRIRGRTSKAIVFDDMQDISNIRLGIINNIIAKAIYRDE